MNRRERAVSASVVILCVVSGFVLSGCISSRSDVSYGSKGPVVGSETLRQIKVGSTSKEWLLGTLGEPTNETRTPEGTEILKYVYTKKVDSDFDAFILLSFDDEREERTVLYFEITDGIVTRYWKEQR
jgi:outer membrane protein assembly factor BamE (lipoprotein component of BamABCDE complex)